MSYRIWIFGPASFPIDPLGMGVICVCGVEVGPSLAVKERKGNFGALQERSDFGDVRLC